MEHVVSGQATDQKYAEIDSQTGRLQGFQTPSRKVEIYATRFAQAGYAASPVLQEPVESPASDTRVAKEYLMLLSLFRVVQSCDKQYRNILRLRPRWPKLSWRSIRV